MNPPQSVIDEAVKYARISDCQKSKRGVVIFDRGGEVVAHGFNGQPEGFNCSGSARCRSSCSTTAVHAEIRALRRLLMSESKNIGPVDMLHVKVVDGELVAGGGPSCVQCSKEILDSGVVKWVWLFEKAFDPDSCDMESRNSQSCDNCLGYACVMCDRDPSLETDCKHDEIERHGAIGKWKRYDVVEFHELSLKARSMFEGV